MRRGAGNSPRGRRALNSRLRAPRAGARLFALGVALVFASARAGPAQLAPERLDRGRFTAVFYPGDARLAASLLARAVSEDSFPGLPRPRERVLIAIAPDHQRFVEWAGPQAPEWGAALAFPESHRVLMQGHTASSEAGNPLEVVRHELAHLALHEYLGDLPPRWFDEGYAGYAAGEWDREDFLTANLALALHGMPTLDELDDGFTGGTTRATQAYALAYRAVAELASLGPPRGLALFFAYWKESGSLDQGIRRAYGMTLASFEERWRANTRRRYGGLALFSDLSLAGLICLFVITPFYLARRRRDRERMAELEAADLAEQSAAECEMEE